MKKIDIIEALIELRAKISSEQKSLNNPWNRKNDTACGVWGGLNSSRMRIEALIRKIKKDEE